MNEKQSLSDFYHSTKKSAGKLNRRVLCQARGLSADHNTITAFIDIPPNSPHGLLLVCSHLECVKSNRKFRYCKVCDIPVAKQNFRQRHGHALVEAYRAKTEISLGNHDKKDSNFVYSLPKMDENELTCFFDWIQHDPNIFE